MTNYAILAGTGALPGILKGALPDAKVVGFNSNPPEIPADLLTNYAETGRVIKFAHDNNIKKMIFAGAMKRPNFAELKPDAEGAKLLAKIVAGRFFGGGDNSLISKIIEFFESRGFEIVGAHEAVPSLLAPLGAIGSVEPTARQLDDIKAGMKDAHELGRKDIGQAVIVENGVVTRREDASGTAAMVASASGGVLVKACKPQQDMRADLPSIGAETIRQLKAAGLTGVAVEGGKSLLLQREEMIKLANENGIFVYGI